MLACFGCPLTSSLNSLCAGPWAGAPALPWVPGVFHVPVSHPVSLSCRCVPVAVPAQSPAARGRCVGSRHSWEPAARSEWGQPEEQRWLLWVLCAAGSVREEGKQSLLGLSGLWLSPGSHGGSGGAAPASPQQGAALRETPAGCSKTAPEPRGELGKLFRTGLFHVFMQSKAWRYFFLRLVRVCNPCFLLWLSMEVFCSKFDPEGMTEKWQVLVEFWFCLFCF